VELSKRNLADLESGARVSVDERKSDPLDFALWKSAKPGEPAWDSPWGKGRPGWHIECSAMSMKYLGEEFDIHGGGLDLIFPHHTNEIAQSEGATGKKFAKLWMHNGFVTVNQEKMSKSLGNFFTLKDVLAKYDPMVVRYFLISTHYRSPLNFSDHELDAAKKVWVDRISVAYGMVKSAEGSKGKTALGTWTALQKLIENFDAGMSQDLSTPTALAALNEYCSHIFGLEKISNDIDAADWSKVRQGFDHMLNLLGLKVSAEITIDPELEKFLKERDEARKTKNWARSDEIRKELLARGVLVEDTPSGPRLKKVTSS
jgi:cysteinyl-tRNA synthetase